MFLILWVLWHICYLCDVLDLQYSSRNYHIIMVFYNDGYRTGTCRKLAQGMIQKSLDTRSSMLKHRESSDFWPSCMRKDRLLLVSRDGMFLKTVAASRSFIMNTFQRINRKFSLSCIL